MQRTKWVGVVMLVTLGCLVPYILRSVHQNSTSVTMIHHTAASYADPQVVPLGITQAGGPTIPRQANDSTISASRGTALDARQRGWLLFLDGHPAAAVDAFDHAIVASGSDAVTRDARAQALVAMDKVDAAIAVWRELRAPARLVALGDYVMSQGDLAQAVTAYRTAVDIAPEYVDAYYRLGQALQRDGDVAGALSAFHGARRLVPDSPWPYMNIGDLYSSLHQIEAAVPWYVKAYQTAPTDSSVKHKLAHAHVAHGNAARVAKEFTRARQAYQKALGVVAHYAPAYLGLATLAWEGDGDRRAATTLLSRVMVRDPQHHGAYVLMGDIVAGDNPEAASRWYDKAISVLYEKSPQTAETFAQLGMVRARQQRFKDAVTQLKKAIELAPANEWYHIALGDIYRQAQEIEQARREYRRAVEINPMNSHARHQLDALTPRMKGE